MVVEAKLVSRSADGRRVQVTVMLGEDREKRSVTRHLRREKGAWMGHNHDEAAVAVTRRARASFNEARNRDKSLKVLEELDLNTLIEIRAEFREKGQYDAILPEELEPLRGRIFGLFSIGLHPAAVQTRFEASAARAAVDLKTAQEHFEKVRVPEKVEFTFS